MRARWHLMLAASLTSSSGCLVGPQYRRPDATTIPPAYAEATREWKPATPRAELSKGPWWEMFGDAELDQLERDAAGANQDLQAAAARYGQARALGDVAGAGLFPRVGASGSGIRELDSENRPVGGHPGKTYDVFTASFDAAWELDLWGGVRRRVEAATAQGEASAADLQGIALSISAEVAADYFAVRELDAELRLLRTSVEVYARSLDLVRTRRAVGIVTDLDVAQAETVLHATEVQIPATELQRARFEHALAALTGRNASLFSLPERPLDVEAPVVPPGVPSELLERRPDISAAERRMAAANAGIGVAQAAFFPTIRLSGSAGFNSGTTSNLFEWPSRFWAWGPSISVPLFQGGQLDANLRVSKSGFEESVARYRQTVLAAFAEVETNLAAQRLLASERESESAALEAARKQLEIANNRYKAGLVTFLNVAVAQSVALDHERAAIRLQGGQCAAAVAVVKSLGGAWARE
jgi:outer membrane protein, multidrug efflux system